MLEGAKHARLRIDTVSCKGNYEWTMGVNYVVTGESRIHTVLLGPFTSYGTGQATSILSGFQDSTGTVHVDMKRSSTGVDPDCVTRYSY